MKSENSKTSGPHRLLLNLSDKINLKRSDKYVFLSILKVHYAWKNIKKWYKNNKLINNLISAPTWNGLFEFSDGSYPVSRLFWIYLKKTWNSYW